MGLKDMYDLLEVTAVDAHNDRVIEKARARKEKYG